MEQLKELSLITRIILFITGLILVVLLPAYGIWILISGYGFENKYATYLIYFGILCILLWLFIKSLMVIPTGSVGVPTILQTRYKGFVVPEGMTWLPFISVIPVDKTKRIVDIDFVITPKDRIQLDVSTNVEYSIVDPYLFLGELQHGDDGFKKIRGGIKEIITKYSSDKGLTGDYLLGNKSQLKKLSVANYLFM